MHKSLFVALIASFGMIAASPVSHAGAGAGMTKTSLTPAEQQLLDRALAPGASAQDKERARSLCKKCKPCFDGNVCDLKCVKDHCANVR